MIINLIIGDYHGDGHTRTESVTIEHSLSSHDELREAYAKGCELVGFDLTQCCQDYDDNKIPPDKMALLTQAGLKCEDLMGLDDEGNGIFEDRYWFAGVWIAIAKLGNPELKCEILSSLDSEIYIGGYGLFKIF